MRRICHNSRVIACPNIVEGGKRRGEVCGKPIRGYLVHGHGRCAYHLTAKERVRVLAVVRAEREMRELRMVKPSESCSEQPEAECDDHTKSAIDFDRFADASLDE